LKTPLYRRATPNANFKAARETRHRTLGQVPREAFRSLLTCAARIC